MFLYMYIRANYFGEFILVYELAFSCDLLGCLLNGDAHYMQLNIHVVPKSVDFYNIMTMLWDCLILERPGA